MIQAFNTNLTYFRIRKIIGLSGLSLPILTPLISDETLPSISHSYYSEASVLFTGVLILCGVFLICYKGFEGKEGEMVSDNAITWLAGICILIVAFIPTGHELCCEGSITPPMPVCNCDVWLSGLHFGSAVLFFVCMSYLSIVHFTRHHRDEIPSRDKRIRNTIYRICGWSMFATLLFAGLGYLVQAVSEFQLPDRFVFIIEFILLIFFGVAWLIKGKALADLNIQEDNDRMAKEDKRSINRAFANIYKAIINGQGSTKDLIDYSESPIFKAKVDDSEDDEDDFSDLQAGDRIGKRVIETIYMQYKDFIIYKKVGSWELCISCSDEINLNEPKFISQYSYLCGIINNSERRKYIKRMALAYELSLLGQNDEAITILLQIEQTIYRKRIIMGRMLYLLGGLIQIVVAFIVWLSIPAFETTINNFEIDFKKLFKIIAISGVGGFMSMNIVNRRQEVDVKATKLYHLIGGGSRIVVSMFAGIGIYFLVQGEIVLGMLEINDTYTLYGIAFISGFSEMFVPNLLKVAEKDLISAHREEQEPFVPDPAAPPENMKSITITDPNTGKKVLAYVPDVVRDS